MTVPPLGDPAAAIRDALELGQLRFGAQHRRPFADALAALSRLEREAAERETALLAHKYPPTEEAARMYAGDLIAGLEARVREVEAERDRLDERRRRLNETAGVFAQRAHRAEATAARQAETLREIAEWPFNSTTGGGLDEPARLARAVLASPEAPAAEPPRSYYTHERCGASWSLDGDWAEAMCPTCRVPVRRRPSRPIGSPAVDAPPEPTT